MGAMNAARLPLLAMVTLSWIGPLCSADGDPAPEKAPPGAHAVPYQGGPWHGLGQSIGGEAISGPPAAAIRTKELRKHLEASKEELRRRDAGLDPNWQISTKALREAVRRDEALLKAREAAGNRLDFPTSGDENPWCPPA